MSSFLVMGVGDTRNRWRDGQVCPDVDKEIWRIGPDGSGGRRGSEKRKGRRVQLERTDGRRGQENPGEKGMRRKRRERDESRRRKKRVGVRESEARLEWRKGLSPGIGVKKTTNAGGVENGDMN
ncbi:hypothetical protein TNCV_171971 [Trichonephila clavipes]|nr:hypothetical protein TNCV_171971 [Trichonephila clavipes]